MDLPYFASRIEDGLNQRLVVSRRERGWRPRIVGYTGYGSVSSLHVLGRVIMSDPKVRYIENGATPENANPGKVETSRLRRKRAAQDDGPIRPTQLALDAQRGWRNFAATPVAHLPITIRAGRTTLSTTTDKGGYINALLQDHGLEPGWHRVEITGKAAEPVRAWVNVISPQQRFGVVSDIDDTVMVTWLPRALIAAWNSFVMRSDARQPVPGMAKLYRTLQQREKDLPFFYLSTGAWNVVPTLRRFFQRHGFPYGTMLMTDWGPTQTALFRSGQEHKRVQLRNLAVTFPNITWLLIGDDGQHDPMIYDDFAREHPTHVAAIAIRELTPAEQVLSHGTTESMSEPHSVRNAEAEHGVPEVRGRDGRAIARRLLEILDKRREEMEQERAASLALLPKELRGPGAV